MGSLGRGGGGTASKPKLKEARVPASRMGSILGAQSLEFSKVRGWQVQVRLTLCLLWAHLSLFAQLPVFLARTLAQMTARLEALEKQIALKK